MAGSTSSNAAFTDRTMVVSGGSRGIGLAIALGAARHGANVVLLAKTAEPHPKLPGTVHTAVAEVEAAGGKGVAVVGDVRNEDDVVRAVDTAVERFGGIDIVVNNASAIATEPTENLTAKKFDLMMDINVRGTFLLTKAALPHLRAAGGNIVNVSSIAGVEGEVYSAGYCAAKHGLVGLTRALAIEFTKDRLRVNAICPGGMPTAQTTEFQAPENADWDLIMRIASPRGFMDTADVAKTIAFLASDDAAAIHGAVYRVDNGKGAG